MLCSEPLTEKWEAFGWHAQRVNGNDLAAVVTAFDTAREVKDAKPRVIIFDTTMCKGVPFLESREITHFVRVEADEWDKALAVLEEGSPHDARIHGPQIRSPQASRRRTPGDFRHDRLARRGGLRHVNAPFGNALIEAARKDERIVGLTADLGKYTDLHVFANAMPDRFYQMGMAEQVLMSAAAGLAREGFLPFATTICRLRLAPRL